ncbi:MAG: hypothetical protein A2589_03100 [Candidatus Vogelbacteria bacterium RIFOXYD1_FULL_46_19]|uniref:YggT family protein n=1 Tax=Candidatus Vogelbacteria bacterium RIFOXYD1_FULL_46_19 TaxID=1802439 RepID=A0A1G2QIF2_9BACT|nr:MAG: hypothetical protein A2589_03100 [Candidatus Vogelbacteria bacterium RIFOXYD1_FULL_46_19]
MNANSRLIIVYLINLIFGLIIALLGGRLILKLLGANLVTPFTAWLYSTTEPLLTPFANIFPALSPETGSSLEVSTLFALLIYALIGWFCLTTVNKIYLASPNRFDHRP